MHRAIANWQWLVPLPRREDAAVLARPEDARARPLTLGFERSQLVDPSSWSTDPAGFTVHWASRFPDSSLDCVAIPDTAWSRRQWSDPTAALRCVRQSLRPATGVCVGVESVRGGSSWTIAGLPASRHAQLLRRAGFSTTRHYYIVASPERPLHLIPAHRSVLLGWDRAMDGAGGRAAIRRALIGLGLHSALFRYRLIIAWR